MSISFDSSQQHFQANHAKVHPLDHTDKSADQLTDNNTIVMFFIDCRGRFMTTIFIMFITFDLWSCELCPPCVMHPLALQSL